MTELDASMLRPKQQHPHLA